MKPVTDPELLTQLNGTGGDSTGMRQVTDPGTLAKLNERPMLSGHTKGAIVALELRRTPAPVKPQAAPQPRKPLSSFWQVGD